MAHIVIVPANKGDQADTEHIVFSGDVDMKIKEEFGHTMLTVHTEDGSITRFIDPESYSYAAE